MKKSINERGDKSVTVIREVSSLNAVGGRAVKPKKTAEEIRAVLLKNLEKARAAKALYKKQDDEAVARGEMPPSVFRRAQRAFPFIYDDNNARPVPFDVKQHLQDVTVQIPLMQLLYHSPDLQYQYLRYLGGQPMNVRKKTAKDDTMDLDPSASTTALVQVQNILLDTTSRAREEVALQRVMVGIGSQVQEFLLDGGSVVSVVHMSIVEELGLVDKMQGSTKTFRFGNGTVENAVGEVPLRMVFSDEVEVIHNFCITNNPLTPLILGLDFFVKANAHHLPVAEELIFTKTNDSDGMIQTLVVPTHQESPSESNGVLGPTKGKPPASVKLLPARVNHVGNNRVGGPWEVQTDRDWVFQGGESQLIWMDLLGENREEWLTDMVLQPDLSLLRSKDFYVMPTVIKKGHQGPCAIIIANMKPISNVLKKGTGVGSLYQKEFIPKDVPISENLEEVMQLITDMYINYNDEGVPIPGPTFIEGPIFHPTKEALESVNVAVLEIEVHPIRRVCNIHCVQAVESSKFTLGPKLTSKQKADLNQLLHNHEGVFATSLKQVKALNVEPYEIVVKEDAKPVKVSPRVIPHQANEWLKSYLEELLDLDLIEPSNGPWAAAVVLVPSDVNERPARRRKARPLRKKMHVHVGSNTRDIKDVWVMQRVYGLEPVEGRLVAEAPNMDILASQGHYFGDPQEQQVTVDGVESRFTSVAPIDVGAGAKDPYRLCLNYRPVNKCIVDANYPIPQIDFLFTLLARARYFTVLDCLKGFWQLKLKESSRDLTGFITTMGMYRWKRLPMGLKVSPNVWQYYMDQIFSEAKFKYFLLYIDDGLIFSETFEEHLVHIDAILTTAEKASLSLSLKKCKFGFDEVKLLGHVVGVNGFSMDKSKVEKIVKWPIPRNPTEINRFVGLIQYYRRYLPNLSTLLAPINYLRKKDVAYVWGHAQQNSFEECKARLLEDVVLSHPDFTKPFVLYTDASGMGIGACLMQEIESDIYSDDEGVNKQAIYRPVYFGSKGLTEQEKRTSVYEREFLAIVYFIHYFKKYLLGQKFTVCTDQRSLQFLMKFDENASAKVIRWQISLSQYDFDIIYRPGKSNVVADALSRLPEEMSQGPALEDVIEDYWLPINAIRKYEEVSPSFEGQDGRSRYMQKRIKVEYEEAKSEQQKIFGDGIHGMSEEEYHQLVVFLTLWVYPESFNKNQRAGLRGKALKYEVRQGNMLYRINKTKGTKTSRQVLRRSEVIDILKQEHDHLLAGHLGVKRLYNKIKEKYYWPGYYETVKEYVASCKICQKFGPRNPPVPLELRKPVPDEPFYEISMDYISLPLTSGGNNSCLVIVELLTGWVQCFPTPTQSAAFTCISLFQWTCTHGVPQKVYCDNGTHFTAQEVTILMKKSYGLAIKFGIPYHPQGQGKVERSNQEIKRLIRKFSLKYVQEWDTWLPAVEFVLRAVKRRDHGVSAFFLVYGREPRLMVEEDVSDLDIVMEDVDQDEAVLSRIYQVIELHERQIPKAKAAIGVYRIKMKDQYNKKAKEKRFYVGELVLVNRVIPGKEALLEQWQGPYEVIKVIGNNVYKLQDRNLVLNSEYHANELKLYRGRHRLAVPLKIYGQTSEKEKK